MRGTTIFLLFALHVSVGSELQALEVLYSSLSGSQWLNNNGWNGTQPCSFYGVGCNVDRISLGSNNASGFFPVDLWRDLPHLKHLDLSNNTIQGNISSVLTKNVQLQYIDFSSTSLSGPLPSSMSNLVNLQVLNLAGVNIGDVFPSIICSLNSLQELDLTSTQLRGGLNNCTFDLPQLTRLVLDNNALSSFPSTVRSHSLEYLSLNGNNLGAIPDSLCDLVTLRRLYFVKAGINNMIPHCMGRLALRELVYVNNKMFGDIPQGICNLTDLEVLTLDNSGVRGSIPPCIGNMTSLKSLTVRGLGRISNVIPPSLCQLFRLEILNLNDNDINTLPSCLWQLGRLRYFLMSGNSLGELPPFLCQTPALERIEFAFSGMTVIPPCLTNLTSLQYLDFTSNTLTVKSIPYGFGKTNLTYLSIPSMDIQEPLPEDLFLAPIQFFNADHNSIHGAIPDSFRNATQMVHFTAIYNHLTSMPDSIGNLKQLVWFDLSLNEIQSEIPSDLSSCVSLQYFEIRSNSIYGRLPDLSNLTQLTYFGAFANRLEGPLPDSLGRLPLNTIHLGDNNFNGTIPKIWDQLNNTLTTLILSDNFLDGEVNDILSTLTVLTTLDLSNNFFQGNLRPLPHIKKMIQLDLSKNRLSGRLPKYLNLSVPYLSLDFNDFEGELPILPTNLVNLNLAGNRFNGTIPLAYVNNTNLVTLDLSYNQLSGEIPDIWMRMGSLNSLILSHNNLSGSLPPSMSNLFSLNVLKISYNQMSGVLPDVFSALTTLDLSYNNIEGSLPDSICRFSPSQIIILSNNNLSGIPHALSTCNLLRKVDLSYNNMSGYFFDNQCVSPPTHVSLVYLDISHNSFSGKVLFQLPYNLIYFDSSFNRFIDSNTPQSFDGTVKRFQLMTHCYMSDNLFRGYLLTMFTSDNFPSLTELDMSNNALSGTIPGDLGQLNLLKTLLLHNNDLSGQIPDSLGNLNRLTQLSLGYNRLISNDLTPLLRLSGLQVFNLSHNSISATIPPSIELFNHLEEFDLSYNKMKGHIPDELYDIRTLLRLKLDHNDMEGPVSIFSADLLILDLSSNRFSGSTDLVKGLASVSHLNLSHNAFSGVVPDISGKVKLIDVDLSNNQLRGQLSVVDTLVNLEILYLQNNQLNGSLPSLENLKRLRRFDVSHNHLSDNMISGAVLPSTLQTCDMSSNDFQCPISYQSIQSCGAKCERSSTDETVTLQLRLEGQVKNFNSTLFLDTLSQLTTTSISRLKILSIISGSVIVRVSISPASPATPNEGTASRVAEIIDAMAQPGQNLGSYSVLSPAVINPPDEKSPDNNNKMTIIIVCLAVGGVVLITLMIVFTIIYIRSKRAVSLYKNQLKSIDLNSIQLGEAKNSITPWSELSNLKEIGAGAFGIVYKADYRGLRVAVKQIRAEHVTTTQLSDFMGEVALLRRLKAHPIHYLWEFCEGGSLLNYMQANHVTIEHRYKWIFGIALGMYHLHKEKVIHRDLAARNILLSKHLDAKVSDFGLSRETQSVDSAAQTQTNIGPIKWMAPEAMTGRIYSVATDVFSYGVTVWEILTGEEPWPEYTPVEAAVAVIQNGERLKIPDYTEPWLADLIGACWKEDPEMRPRFPDLCDSLAQELKLDKFPEDLMTVPLLRETSTRYSAPAYGDRILNQEKMRDGSILSIPLDVLKEIFNFFDRGQLLPVAFSCSLLRDAINNIHPQIIITHQMTFPTETVELIDWWTSNIRGPSRRGQEISTAATRGQLSIVQHLCHINETMIKERRSRRFWLMIAKIAARYHHMDILRWAVERGDHFKRCNKWGERSLCSRIMAAAAMGGHLDIIKWLAGFETLEGVWITGKSLKPGYHCVHDLRLWSMRRRRSIIEAATANRHQHILEWILEHNHSEEMMSSLYYSAMMKGHIDMMKWALDKYKVLPPQWFSQEAARLGHMDSYLWCRENSIPLLHIEKSHLSVAKFEIDRGHCISVLLLIENNRLDILKYVHSQAIGQCLQQHREILGSISGWLKLVHHFMIMRR
ncbi:LRR receptor-like serine/threonine-protein kinase GSO2-like [Planoprotostelium fungivorum]|uniref:LRR receptor-like serine/threonine-protein kinase GSO2-like n=1 Tax=Planoprotostelium fungivorum TaxID=1890364 RepID=A0A2P6NCG3_9EUKA|nr:LRR receptor-like serine/threonine-protein kinase GSO2-like [Planoprotostelium fungivorum]